MKVGSYSPWGQIQSVKAIAKGIVFVTTYGHGGMKLSEARMREFSKQLPEFTTFAGGPWFEEDQDASAVVLVFHELFTPEQVWFAYKSAISSARPFNMAKPGGEPVYQTYPRWESVVRWLDGAGKDAKNKALAFESENAELYSRGSMGTIPGSECWWVWFNRVKDYHRLECLMPLDTIYSKQFWSASELAPFIKAEAA